MSAPTLGDAISTAAQTWLTEAAAQVAATADDCAEVLAGVKNLLQGGKQLRPQLAQVGWLAATGASPTRITSEVVSLGAALELYQASALVHDDIIDEADTRRGLPATHRLLADVPAQRGWGPKSASFGVHAAILAGDLLFSAAHLALEAATRTAASSATTPVTNTDTPPGTPTAAGERVRLRFHHMTAEVALGQYLDLSAELIPLDLWEPAELLSHTMRVMRHKSARYSVVNPVLLGFELGGGTTDLAAKLEDALLPWGLAFQMRDDDLGVFGDPEVTGKPAGDDLRQGKRTALLAHTWLLSAPAERDWMAAELGSPDLDGQQVARWRAHFLASGGHARHEAAISALSEQAQQKLAALDLPPTALTELTRLGTRLINRQH